MQGNRTVAAAKADNPCKRLVGAGFEKRREP